MSENPLRGLNVFRDFYLQSSERYKHGDGGQDKTFLLSREKTLMVDWCLRTPSEVTGDQTGKCSIRLGHSGLLSPYCKAQPVVQPCLF